MNGSLRFGVRFGKPLVRNTFRGTETSALLLLFALLCIPLFFGCSKTKKTNSSEEKQTESPAAESKKPQSSRDGNEPRKSKNTYLAGQWKGRSPDGSGNIHFDFRPDGTVTWSWSDSQKNQNGAELTASYQLDQSTRPTRITLFDFQQPPFGEAEFRAIVDSITENQIRIEGVMFDPKLSDQPDYPASFSSASAVLARNKQ